MYEFEHIDINDLDIDEYYSFERKSIFTRLEWIRFIMEDSAANPIILRIKRDSIFIGYFSALMIRKFGVKIIASPFRGWSTCFMGFDTLVDNKTEILKDLTGYLFKKFGCLYIEIVDRDISVEQAQAAGFNCASVATLELDIDKSDEEIFKNFKSVCRNRIRQFDKKGASLEHALPDDQFAEEYYEQLKDVFAKQGTLPTYSVDKVKRLLHHLSGTDMLLCLRVRDPDGLSIATSIFIGYNKKFFFWGGASLRPYQHYCPNEYMMWYAIRYWRDKGCSIYDMVGVRDYKRKYNPEEKRYARVTISKYAILIVMRNMALKGYYLLLRFKGFLLRKK